MPNMTTVNIIITIVVTVFSLRQLQTAKAGKPLCLNLRIVKKQRTASKKPWMPEQHRRLVRERTVNTVQVARRTVSPKNIAPATELAKYADAREDITNCLSGVSVSRRELYTPSHASHKSVWPRFGPWGSLCFRCPPGWFVSCQSVGSTVGDFPILIFANPVTPSFTINVFLHLGTA